MQEALARLFGEPIVAQLKAADWKLRKEGMEALLEAVTAWGSFSDGVRVGETVQGLSYLPGWGEKNFQVRWVVLCRHAPHARGDQVVSWAPLLSQEPAACMP